MSEWGYETQSHPVLALDMPLGVTGIDPLITEIKLSLGEGTCQGQTAEPNPRPRGSAPQAGTHFASHVGFGKLEQKGYPSCSIPSKLLQRPHSLAWNSSRRKNTRRLGRCNQQLIQKMGRESQTIKVLRGPKSAAHPQNQKSRGQVMRGRDPKKTSQDESEWGGHIISLFPPFHLQGHY